MLFIYINHTIKVRKKLHGENKRQRRRPPRRSSAGWHKRMESPFSSGASLSIRRRQGGEY